MEMKKGEGMTPEEYIAMVEESDARVYKSQMNAYKERYLALLKANTELEEENKKLKEDIKEIEKNQEYRYHRCMKAERQVQHSLGGDDEEGLYD